MGSLKTLRICVDYFIRERKAKEKAKGISG